MAHPALYRQRVPSPAGQWLYETPELTSNAKNMIRSRVLGAPNCRVQAVSRNYARSSVYHTTPHSQ